MSTVLLRFADLKARGIVSNPVTLARWIDKEGFPPGFMCGTRAYRESDVEAWLASRPIENTTLHGAAKKSREGRK